MTTEQFLLLLDKFHRQALTPEELNVFLDATENVGFEALISEQLTAELQEYQDKAFVGKEREQHVWFRLQQALEKNPDKNVLAQPLPDSRLQETFLKKDPDSRILAQQLTTAPGADSEPIDLKHPKTLHSITSLRRWSWAAAFLIVAAGIGIYFWNNNKKNAGPAVIATAINTTEIAPGKEGAVLTLDDGRKVVLDSLGNGIIAVQNGTEVVLKDGRLAYDQIAKGDQLAYNTVTTPKGRQFNIILPDGSRVWLNAASSVRYPTVFAGAERRVEITGEAYFEVEEKAELPFRVNVNNKAEVEVLGTRFNVNAYENERSINTTLLAGSVKVRIEATGQPTTQRNASLERTVVLKPGQQAQISDAIRTLNNIDTDKVMAWKNGLFNFENATLEEIMRQLERWYDIEVVYEENVPGIELTGKLTRGVTLNGLLPALEKMGVKSRLEGRKLTVLK